MMVFAGRFSCIHLSGHQLVGDVVLVDVAHILHGFTSDNRRRAIFYIAEPHIAIKSHRLRLISEPLESVWSGIIGGKRKQRPVLVIEIRVIDVFGDEEAQVLVTGLDVAFRTFLNSFNGDVQFTRAELGFICMMPTAPDLLRSDCLRADS